MPVPVLASDSGGIPEVIEHGVSGLMLPKNRFTGSARPYSNFSTGVPISPMQSAPPHGNAF